MFLNWFFHRKTIQEVLRQVAGLLSLKNLKLSNYPSPTLTGDYFGFSITLEGSKKKMGFRFLATITLPNILNNRVFLTHEGRKTSFKPVASLKLVTTPNARFNQNFLLLAEEEEKARSVFQSYLCGKIVSLALNNWQLDVSNEEAHLELWQKNLNTNNLCEVLKILFECLNALLVSDGR